MTVKKGERKAEGIDNLMYNIGNLQPKDKLVLITHLIDELKKLQGFETNPSMQTNEFLIPIGAFDNDALSSLEAIVKYLKEIRLVKFSKIAKLLNRSSKTIWATYQKSVKKMPSHFSTVSANILIPVSAFSDRSFSILESLVGFIKNLDYSNHEVAVMLHLDDRTIWTIYDRVKKKRGINIVK